MSTSEMVYVLQVIRPESVALPALFGSLKSAKRSASLGWDDAENPLSWIEDAGGDVFVASPADGVRFLISSQLVQP